MVSKTKNALSGVAQYKEDVGDFYVQGCDVIRSAIVHIEGIRATGLTLEWRVATAANEYAAKAIVEALNVKFAVEIATMRAMIEEAIAASEALA